jgi:hypothetical protein
MSQPYRPQDTNVGPRTYSPAPVPFNLTLPHQNMNPPNANGNNTSSEHTNGNAGPSNPTNPSNDGVNGNGNFDQAALQARIALAQQMAQQGMQQQSQHDQQMHNSQQGQAQERRTSGPTPDWGQLAANSGVGGIMNGAQGATREALMKQVSYKSRTQLTYSYKRSNHHTRLLLGIDWVALLGRVSPHLPHLPD